MVIIKAGLILAVLLCVLATGQKSDENTISGPLENISCNAATTPPSTPSNDSRWVIVPASIIDAALAEGNPNVLVAAIRSAGLVDLLNGYGPFTLFAPTDKAFAEIPQSDLEDILRTNQTLKSVLTYHIVRGNLSSTDFKNGMKVASEEGGVLTFNSSSKGWRVNNANITKTDIVARNGIIHVIDSVLGYEALTTQPQTSGGWLDKGIALKDMGKYNDALKSLDRAIEKDPKSAKAWHEKGLILEILGRKKEAEAGFAKSRILQSNVSMEALKA